MGVHAIDAATNLLGPAESVSFQDLFVWCFSESALLLFQLR
jgi:hypothetical protein